MKKHLMLCFLIFITISAYSQAKKPIPAFPSLKSLEYIYNSISLDEFDDYLGPRGFTFYKISDLETDNDDSVFVEKKVVSFSKNTGSQFLFINVADSETYQVSYSTSSTEEFLKFKTQAKAAGYTLIKSKIVDEYLIASYKRGKFKLDFWSSRPEASSKARYSIYLENTDTVESLGVYQ